METIDAEIKIDPKKRAWELYATIDGYGHPIYKSNREIERVMKSEEYETDDGTIGRWIKEDGWEAKRNTLIASALTQKGAQNLDNTGGVLGLRDFADYAKTLIDIDTKAANILQRGLEQLSCKEKLENKDLALVVKIKEVSGKSIDNLMELLEKANTKKKKSSAAFEALAK